MIMGERPIRAPNSFSFLLAEVIWLAQSQVYLPG